LTDLCNLTGGAGASGTFTPGTRKISPEIIEAAIHKNSLIKLRQLRLGYAVIIRPRGHSSGTRPTWAVVDNPVPYAAGGRIYWLWNPQIDTLEKLELVLVEAERRGFQPTDKPQTFSVPKRRVYFPKKGPPIVVKASKKPAKAKASPAKAKISKPPKMADTPPPAPVAIRKKKSTRSGRARQAA
jgi:hypothetical protein